MLFQFALFISICSAVTVSAQEEGNLRLIQGPNGCEGHLQVLVTNNGQLQWSSACDRRFGIEELQVACRQAGCPAGNPQRRTVESYGGRLPSGSVYQAFGYSCEGSEGKVVDCPYTGAVCDLRQNSDIIAVACLEGGSQPATTALTAPGSLSGGYQLRLAGGSDRCQGDLEVYVPFLGVWALALSREFGNDEAAVTCSELSCGAPVRVATASRTAGPYLEVGYECDRSESRLQDCSPIPLFSRSSEYYLHIQCQVPPSQGVGDLRLFRGPNRCEGHLQVLVPSNGQLQWSSACDRGVGAEELQVACRQIGCPSGNPQRRTVESYGGRLPRGSVYRAFGFSCEGSEGKVVDCPYTGAVCDLGGNGDIIAVACL